MNHHLLEIKKLSISFGKGDRAYPVVSDITLFLSKGKTLALVGESGCGKTLTALSILRLLPETASLQAEAIRLLDKDLLHANPQEIRSVRGASIGMVFQEPMSSLNPVFNIGIQIEEVLCAHGWHDRRTRHDRVMEVLKQVQFPYASRCYRLYPHELSGGLRQRAMLAIALVCNPLLLIADEPTTALDVTIQSEILQLLIEIRSRQGMSVLLITHDLGIVSDISDDVCVMYAGQIVEKAPVDELFSSPLHPYTQRLLKALPHQAEKGQRLESIQGSVVDPRKRPQGCLFHPRCKEQKNHCMETEAELIEISPGHWVRCWERK